MKKFASLLLTVVLLATMLTVFAVPAFATGEFDFSSYCLCGYINGSDYGMTEQSNPKWYEPGEYRFSKDGILTVTFETFSLVQVKDSYGRTFYAFEKFVVDGTPTRLYPNSDNIKEKMFVPGGTTVTFTLTKDENGALVLGYRSGDTLSFAVSFAVSFDMMNHGEQVSSQTVNEGEKVQKPTDPTADGYTFDGWYKDAALKTPWNFANDTVTANTTLYAKWIRTLEFDFSPYCLCGYINGEDYGMTEQSNPKWNAPGEYVFSNDGKLTVTFEKDSYVQMKTLYGECWYAFEKFVVDGTPTRLYPNSDNIKEKMFVPGGTKVTFTLTKDENGAFVLGYDTTTATASTLSEGNMTIICTVAAAVVFGLGGFILGTKKKKPALADGTDNTDEE